MKDFLKIPQCEIIKDINFWKDVRQDYRERCHRIFLCTSSLLFEYFWNKPTFRKLCKRKAKEFMLEKSIDSCKGDGSVLFCTGNLDLGRSIRVKFLNWMINKLKNNENR